MQKLEIDRIVSGKIDSDNAGSFRKIPARIAGSVVPSPNYLNLPDLMDEFVSNIHRASEENSNMNLLLLPLEIVWLRSIFRCEANVSTEQALDAYPESAI